MNLDLLVLNLICGSLVLLSYMYFLPLIRKNNVSLNAMWGQITGTERNLTYLSMLVSTVSFIYVLYYFTNNNIKHRKLVYLGFSLFFIGAISWAPLLYKYFLNKNETTSLLMILALCLTTMGIILLMVYIFSLEKNYLLKLAISLFGFHILFLDNLNYATRFVN